MRADNLDHAIELANRTSYGLTSGISSLDEREQKKWLEKIEAGNLYLNRSITGAIVKRQAFGGCKASCFGYGSKAGGPNYIYHLANATQVKLPSLVSPPSEEVNHLLSLLEKNPLTAEELGVWYASVSDYTHEHKKLPSHYNPEKPQGLSELVVGQDNGLYYVPRTRMGLRIQKTDSVLDLFRILAAALVSKVHLEISFSSNTCPLLITKEWKNKLSKFTFVEESYEHFLKRIASGHFERLRLASAPDNALRKVAAEAACFLDHDEVLATGRFELLHYLREVAVSADYHRYGNLGLREKEQRKPIL
jgi:RHH-type proline utilization regulon transcriptional repressor/proline dehydrogenase/delta 1-pyrroline-5-carboxylate dehydrogenase